jgi:hypothetical protein
MWELTITVILGATQIKIHKTSSPSTFTPSQLPATRQPPTPKSTVLPKHRVRQGSRTGMYVGDRSNELARDQLLPTTSTRSTPRTQYQTATSPKKWPSTTIELVELRKPKTRPTNIPRTTGNQVSKSASTEGSGYSSAPNFEDGQLLLPTAQLGRTSLQKQTTKQSEVELIVNRLLNYQVIIIDLF